MTRPTNARIAGTAFLAYIATGIPAMVLFRRATSGDTIAAKLAAVARHASDVRVATLLVMVGCFSALVLAVTLHAITREEDPDLAMLGLVCRVAEGVISGMSIFGTLALLWLATATGVDSPDPAAARALAAYLLRDDMAVTATFFAVGSTAFAWLLLRGRMIPTPLAWLGVVASVLLVIGLPLQMTGVLGAPITSLMYLPMLAFEVPLALWLLVKGVATSATTQST